MILKHRKGAIPVALGVAVALFLAIFTLRGSYFSDYKHELFSYWMTLDPGFSNAKTLEEFFSKARGHYLEIVYGQIAGFSERPPLERVDIDIKFPDMQAILKDREIALENSILSNPTKVPAQIRFQGKTIKAKIRLKGDLADHWQTRTRMSLRVTLKGNNAIFGFRSFSIHKPRNRQHPYDQIYQSLRKKMGSLSSTHTYARIFVNGIDWGVMNIEEHMSKELLEKRGFKDSLIVRFGDEKSWVYSRSFGGEKRKLGGYRLSDVYLNTKLYNANKYLEKNIHRKWFSYIANKRLQENSRALYDANKFSQALMLTEVWNNRHVLSHSNTRYYFSPYTLKLEPITTDQGPFKPWSKGRGGSKFDPMRYKLYQEVASSEDYAANFSKNLNAVKKAVKTAKEDINFYHSFFPLDPQPSSKVLQRNLRKVMRRPEGYLPIDYQLKAKKPGKARNREVSEKDAKHFPDHIHARHYMDGTIDIFNLVPTKIDLISVNFKGTPALLLNKELDAYIPRDYKPGITVQTSLKGVRDEKISVVTEFEGQRREHLIPVTLYRDQLYNPLPDFNPKSFNFISTAGSSSWQILKGKWLVNRPIRIKGDLIIPAGVELSFSKDAYLMVAGTVDMRGTKENKIILKPQNEHWKGLYVHSDKSKSKLENVIIRNTQSLQDGLLQLTGGVTFYNSDVTLKRVIFDGTEAEDALNIVHSKFELYRVGINSTVSDGFDGDFSVGAVRRSAFDDIGGDALDFSGSEVLIKHTDITNVHDKAISVGEASTVNVDGGNLNNVGVAFASKDGSNAIISNVKVGNYALHIAMTYLKKNFYEQPSLELIDCKIDGIASYSRQQGTQLIVDGQEIIQQKLDVKNLYKSGVMKK